MYQNTINFYSHFTCHCQYAHHISRYIKYLIGLYMENAYTYVPYMKSLPSTMQKSTVHIFEIHFWTYGLSHCKYSSHSQHAKWAYRTNILHIYTTNHNSYFTGYYKILARNKYTHQIWHTCHIVKLFDVPIWRKYSNIYMPHMKSLTSITWPGPLYTVDNNYNDTNAIAASKAQLHKLSWPFANSAKKTIDTNLKIRSQLLVLRSLLYQKQVHICVIY